MRTCLIVFLIFLFSTPYLLFSQNSDSAAAKSIFNEDKELSNALLNIVKEAGLDSVFDVGEDGTEQISLAVIALNGKNAVLGGVNFDNFIYPASVYKMYAGAEVLRQISEGLYYLHSPYIVKSPNDVDKSREIAWDPRPLLKDGDTVTINYLLDLMITRSDNSAANCIIDIAGREKINELMHMYGWQGSEVTRKFLSRKYEDPGYEKIRSTETSALHAADFMYRIETNTLVNPWVSMQMKALLGRQLDRGKLAAGLPDEAVFYHKTGWWSYWTNDVGIVDNGKVKYIVALFTPVPEAEASSRMSKVSTDIYKLMQTYKVK